MARIIFNEDPNHFIFSRARAGKTEITQEDCRMFIAQYADTDVTDFMICVNASIPWYDSKKTKSIITKYKEWLGDGRIPCDESDLTLRSIGLLSDFYDRTGKVPQDLWIPALRELGIRPWTSIRMNDIHECDREDSILFSDFYRENRKKNRAAHRDAMSYYEHGLDYLQKEVREHYLCVIEEALERFDTDGLELDWMREIYSIQIGREYEAISVITAFMKEIHRMVKRMEAKRGHRIGMAVRLPSSPEKALRLGFDAFDWADKGLIDLITVTSRWSSVDNDMPIDVWKRAFKGRRVAIAAGLEILLDAYNRRGRAYEYNTFETAVGSACANFAMGADATYLFNYMDAPVSFTKDPEGDSLLRGERYHKFLTTVGDYKKCIAEKRRHVVTYDDVFGTDAPVKKQLPVTLQGDGTPAGFAALRIVTGEIPQERRLEVVLGLEGIENFAPEELILYISARPMKLLGERAPIERQYEDLRYFAFAPDTDEKLPPVSVLEMGLQDGKAVVHWAEIDVI